MPITLTEQQLFDYINCPVKYDLKHNKKIVLHDDNTINSILKSVTNYFYMFVMTNLKTPTFNNISRKFESIYKSKLEVSNSKQYTDGLFKLRNFYNWACDGQVAVIDNDIRYAIAHKDIRLEGTMNPIAMNKNKQLEFLIMNFSSRTPEQLEIDTKLKYSIDMLAFNDTNQEFKVLGTKIHNVKSGKDLFTTRNKIDYDRLLSSIEGVAKGIQNNIYYPRESHMCSSCNYKNYCRSWRKE